MNDESDDDIYARNPAGAADSDDGSAGDEGDGAFGADAAQRSPKPVIVVVPTSAAGLDVDVDVPTRLSSPAINPLLICQMTLFQGHFGDNCAMTRGFGRMSAFYEDPSEPKVPSFRPAVVSKSIHQVLADRLTGATYHPDTCSQWTREIADEIKNKLKELELPRYKYIVHVTMGEMRGEGVRIGTRCFWDADTDNIAQDAFMNVG
nr:Tctex1 domain-containing protein 2 [Polyrhizophydium stewartii]